MLQFKRGSEVSAIKYIIITIILLGLGIFMIGTFISEKISLSKGMTDFNEMKSEEFRKGRFVQGTVKEIDTAFAYERTDSVTSRYYIMPLYGYDDNEDGKFIVIRFTNKSDIEKADKLVDEVTAYLKDGKTPESSTSIEITGKVSKLDKKIEGFLYDTLIEAGYGENKEECSKYVCPYYIRVKQGADPTGLIMGFVSLFGAYGTFFLAVRVNKLIIKNKL